MVIKETILEMIVTVKSLGLFLLIPSMYICIFMYILADFSCDIPFSLRCVNAQSSLCQ